MSLLETFFILFDTNAKEAARDVGGLEHKVEDLNRDLSTAERSAYNAGVQLGSMVKGLVGIAAAYLTVQAAAGVFNSVVETSGAVADLGQFADGLDLSITKLDAFQRVAKTSGSSAESAFTGLTMVNKMIGEALKDVDGEQAKLFKTLGVNLKDAEGNTRNVLDVLLDTAGAVEKMSKAEATSYLKSLGIRDNKMISMLLLGKSALSEMIKEQERGGAVTERQREVAERLDAKMDELELSYDTLKLSIMELVGDGIVWFIDKARELGTWLAEHRDFLVGALAPAIVLITGLTAQWALATLAATWPFLLLAAAIGVVLAVIGLLYEDFMVWKRGGKSVIGDLVGSFEEMNKTLGPIIDKLRAISKWFDDIRAKGGLIRMGIEWVGEQMGPKGIGLVSPRRTMAAVGSGQNLLGMSQQARLGAQTSGSILMAGRQPASKTNIVGPVNVHTQATDAEGTGRAVSNAIGKEMRYAADNADDGIDR